MSLLATASDGPTSPSPLLLPLSRWQGVAGACVGMAARKDASAVSVFFLCRMLLLMQQKAPPESRTTRSTSIGEVAAGRGPFPRPSNLQAGANEWNKYMVYTLGYPVMPHATLILYNKTSYTYYCH